MTEPIHEQTLERIAIDRATGQWNDDLEQLLQRYLDARPQARAEMEAIGECVNLAGAALQSADMPAMPTIDASQLLGRAVWRQRMGIGLAMAACLVVGLTFGLWSTPAPQRTQAVAFDAWLAGATEQTTTPQQDSLWSRQHWQQRLQQSQTSEPRESTPNRQTFNRIFGG